MTKAPLQGAQRRIVFDNSQVNKETKKPLSASKLTSKEKRHLLADRNRLSLNDNDELKEEADGTLQDMEISWSDEEEYVKNNPKSSKNNGKKFESRNSSILGNDSYFVREKWLKHNRDQRRSNFNKFRKIYYSSSTLKTKSAIKTVKTKKSVKHYVTTDESANISSFSNISNIHNFYDNFDREWASLNRNDTLENTSLDFSQSGILFEGSRSRSFVQSHLTTINRLSDVYVKSPRNRKVFSAPNPSETVKAKIEIDRIGSSIENFRFWNFLPVLLVIYITLTTFLYFKDDFKK